MRGEKTNMYKKIGSLTVEYKINVITRELFIGYRTIEETINNKINVMSFQVDEYKLDDLIEIIEGDFMNYDAHEEALTEWEESDLERAGDENYLIKFITKGKK